MMTYREYIEGLRVKWIGKQVKWDGALHNVVDVDYNGALIIDLPGRFTPTTAIPISAERGMIDEDSVN